jgi:hypothetical protein
MRNLRLIPGLLGRLLRMRSFALAAILLVAALAASAQSGNGEGYPGVTSSANKPQNIPQNVAQGSLVGTWRGVFQGITMTIVVQSNGQYVQTNQKGSLMTQQSGPYKLGPNNTIIFSVTNWTPKTQRIYHPNPPSRDGTPSAGGYYTNQVVAKPPGGTDTYVFNGPNTITLTDQVVHGSITMNRGQ